MPLFPMLLVLGVAFSGPAVAQTPSGTAQHEQYIKTRLVANAREQKKIADALKDILRQGYERPGRAGHIT